MRFALITDVHFGHNAYFDGKLRKLSHHAASLCQRFVDRMNGSEQPDWVVNLGDVIEDESHAADLEAYAKFTQIMGALQAPLLHVAGNHDSINLTDDDLQRLWDHTGPLYYSRDLPGIHLVVLRTHEHHGKVSLDEAQLEWLEADLAGAPARSLIFMHHPASEMVLDGNRWFEKAPSICRVAERRRLRQLLEASGNVIAVFNGHVHWNHFDVIAGIPYFTLQSLTENVDDDAPGRPAAAFAVCDLDAHRLHIRVEGEQPARYQVERPR